MKKVLVTGANGFLAANIIEQLIKKGYIVRGMIRKNADLKSVYNLQFEYFFGDMTDKKDVFKAVSDVDYVIHAAADTSPVMKKYRSLYRVNYLSTAHIVEACKLFKISRLIFVSSANTIAFANKNNQGYEHNSISPLFFKSFYARSKLMAENLVLNEVKNCDLNAIIVNPTFMLGNRDAKPGSGKIIKMYSGKRLVFIPDGGKNFIHVKDASKAIVNALIMGKYGERYLLCNENLKYSAFINLLETIEKRKKITIVIPNFLLIFIGFVGCFFNKLGLNSAINPVNMKLLCINNFYNSRKAVDVLKMPQTPVINAITDALNWFMNNKE